jgi:hypothetical protein
MEEALDVLRRGDETKVAVPVSVARRIGDSSWVFEQHPVTTLTTTQGFGRAPSHQ